MLRFPSLSTRGASRVLGDCTGNGLEAAVTARSCGWSVPGAAQISLCRSAPLGEIALFQRRVDAHTKLRIRVVERP